MKVFSVVVESFNQNIEIFSHQNEIFRKFHILWNLRERNSILLWLGICFSVISKNTTHDRTFCYWYNLVLALNKWSGISFFWWREEVVRLGTSEKFYDYSFFTCLFKNSLEVLSFTHMLIWEVCDPTFHFSKYRPIMTNLACRSRMYSKLLSSYSL